MSMKGKALFIYRIALIIITQNNWLLLRPNPIPLSFGGPKNLRSSEKCQRGLPFMCRNLEGGGRSIL